MAKIIKDDPSAEKERRCCFFCEHFFCTRYSHSAKRNRIVCAGGLPKLEMLTFLMKETAGPYTCRKFVMAEHWKEISIKQR